MIPPRLVLATANPGKASELKALVGAWGPVDVASLADHPAVRPPAEGAASYEENARAKAAAVAGATGLPSLADDSGLEVEALGGGPGVLSARWGGPGLGDAERNVCLLSALAAVPAAGRRACFRCVVALAWPDGRVVTAGGECRGAIAFEARGAGGFGYDPVFVSDELGRTLAEVPPATKARVSHRARAVRALGERLRRS